MKSISENFNIIIDIQKTLGYSFPRLLEKPAKAISIHKAEQLLNFTFNLELKELYQFANGTKIPKNESLTYGMIGLIPIYNFMSLKSSTDYYKSVTGIINNSLDDFFLNIKTNYKPNIKLFPFLEDGCGNCYWVDLNYDTDNYGKIFETNTFGENPDYAFTSLISMFHTIAECYENGSINVDNEKNLTCEYTNWYLSGKRNNPNLSYWDKFFTD
jgi:cell wall assembly regulator SMI1